MMKPVALHCMFHGISDKATGFKLCIFVPTIPFISTHLVRLGPSALSTWSQVPTNFCPWISWMIPISTGQSTTEIYSGIGFSAPAVHDPSYAIP